MSPVHPCIDDGDMNTLAIDSLGMQTIYASHDMRAERIAQLTSRGMRSEGDLVSVRLRWTHVANWCDALDSMHARNQGQVLGIVKRNAQSHEQLLVDKLLTDAEIVGWRTSRVC